MTHLFDITTLPRPSKAELIAIRDGFKSRHSVPVGAHATHEAVDAFDIDYGYAASQCLTDLVNELVQEDHKGKSQWLLAVVFDFGRKMVFITFKDCHVHVMVSLDLLVNSSQ